MGHTVTVDRKVTIELPPPAGSLQALIDELTAVRDRPAIGPDAVVQSISGGGQRVQLVIVKPD